MLVELGIDPPQKYKFSTIIYYYSRNEGIFGFVFFGF